MSLIQAGFSRSETAIASDPAFAAIYEPKATAIWVPQTDFFFSVGTPVEAIIGSHTSGWLMDDTSNERVTTNLFLPPSWSTVTMEVFWAPVNGTAGNVVWQCGIRSFGAGAVITGATYAPSITAAANGTAKLVRSISDPIAVVPGVLGQFDVGRLGSSGSDSFVGDAAFFGLLITRAS